MTKSYDSCPCLSGQKAKHCWPRGEQSNLDKILRALEGDQMAAALQRIDTLIAKHPDSACLRRTKLRLLFQSQRHGALREAWQGLNQIAPDDPMTKCLDYLTHPALEEGQDDESLDEWIAFVQRINLESEGVITAWHVPTLRQLTEELQENGRLVAASAHAHLLFSITRSETDARMAQQLLIDGNPLVLRRQWAKKPPADQVPWLGELTAASKLAGRGAWQAAVEILETLASKVPNEPAILVRLAVFSSSFDHPAIARKHWVRYARAEPDRAEAAEAMAVAQVLGGEAGESSDMQFWTVPVANPESVNQKLTELPNLRKVDLTAEDEGRDGEPGPRLHYIILNKPAKDGDLADAASLPRTCGKLWFYGRETDREARLAIQLVRVADAEKAVRAVIDKLVPAALIETTSRMPILSVMALGEYTLDLTQHQLPEDDPQATLRRLKREFWADLPLPELQGKTSKEAAEDPKLALELDAVTLLFQHMFGSDPDDDRQLRQDLGLPERSFKVDGMQELSEFPLTRFAEAQVESFDSEMLKAAMQGALTVKHKAGAINVWREINNRVVDDLEAFPEFAAYCCVIASMGHDSLATIRRGQDFCEKTNISPGLCLAIELQILIASTDDENVERLGHVIRDIQQYLDEPEVQRIAMPILNYIQQISQSQSQAAEMAPAQESSKSELWLPGSSAPANTPNAAPGGQGGDKPGSGLWLPPG